MLPALASLIALQSLDTAAEALRRRLAEMPVTERTIEAGLTAARAGVDDAKARLHENQTARRSLEKDVAAVDTRMARFEDHKAAVKTNQEYTALLHEIAGAKTEKDAIEERLLVLMEEGDALGAALKAAERALAEAESQAARDRAAMAAERTTVEAELARLAGERTMEARGVDASVLAKYEQLIKQRKGIAIAKVTGEICTACHVRLRPHFTQQVRRNDSIIQCDSCQRMLYFVAPVP